MRLERLWRPRRQAFLFLALWLGHLHGFGCGSDLLSDDGINFRLHRTERGFDWRIHKGISFIHRVREAFFNPSLSLIYLVYLRYLKAVVELALSEKTPYQGLKPMTQSDTWRDVDGVQLRSIRLAAGMTQQQLADLLGVQRVTITRAEGTESRPSNPSRLLQSLLDQALSRGELRIPRESKKKSTPKKKR